MHLLERVFINLNLLEQKRYVSATLDKLHDKFIELCSQTFILGKRMEFDLKKNKD